MLLAVMLPLCGCSEEVGEVPELLEPVGNVEQTYTVTRSDITAYHTNSDVTLAADSTAVYFENGGYVGNFAVSIGVTVQKGDLIATLEDPDLQKQYQAVSEDIETLKSNHALQEQMLSCDIEIAKLTLQKLQQEEAQDVEIESQKLVIEEAELALTHCNEQYAYDLSELQSKSDAYRKRIEHNKLYAPTSGMIAYLPDTTKGRVYLTDSTPCALIVDENALTIRMDYISDSKAYETYYGYTALIDGVEYPLTLQQPTASAYTETVKSGKTPYTSFVFTDGVPEGVTTASVVTLQLYYYEAKDVLAVPYHALQFDGSQYSLDIERDGKRMVRRVTVGQITSNQAVILEGLQEGDIVYV